jgi:hemin uptake protein HemP
MTGREPKDEPDQKRRAGDTPVPVPTVCSEELLRGGRQLEIVHGSEVYRLVLTRNNKLILQK